MFLSSVTYHRRMWGTFGGENGGGEKHFINIYQSCFCQPSLAVIRRRRRQPSIITSSLAGTERRAVSPPPEPEEPREANVNNCKPIKITLHLSLDLYWVAFQFSFVRLSVRLEGLGGLLERLSFTRQVFFLLCFVFPAWVEAAGDASWSGDSTKKIFRKYRQCVFSVGLNLRWRTWELGLHDLR